MPVILMRPRGWTPLEKYFPTTGWNFFPTDFPTDFQPIFQPIVGVGLSTGKIVVGLLGLKVTRRQKSNKTLTNNKLYI